ncbi:MAG: hypothetical protein ACI4EH_03215 [Oliverpabstia sp.]
MDRDLPHRNEISEETDFRAIADTTLLMPGCAKTFTADELYEILRECV